MLTFRLHYRAVVTQPAWKGHPNRRVNQRNRRGRNEHSAATCYLRKMPKCALEKRRPVEGVVPGKLDRSPAPTAQISSTRITALDVKVNGLKLLRENREKALHDVGKDCLKRAPAGQEIKARTSK